MAEMSAPLAINEQSDLSGSGYTNIDKHYTHIVQALKTIHEQQLFVDVVLISRIDGTKVNASKIILSSFSHYFFSMFTGGFEESKSEEITLNFDGAILNAIVKYLYTASIHFDEGNVERILIAADFFQMNDLKNACCSFMEDHLEPDNCLLMALMANKYSLTRLFKKSLAILDKHFADIRCGSEFFNLSLDELETLLKEDCFTSQEELFSGLVSWVHHDMPSRGKFLCKLLANIRFVSLTLEFICKQAETVSTTCEFYELMIKWINSHVIYKKPTKNLLICLAEDDNYLQVQSYDPESKKLSLAYFKLPFLWPSEYSTVAFNELLFFIGWYSGEVLCLNRKTAAWEILPSMNAQRIEPGLAELNGQLYAVGGQNEAGNWLSSVETFDIVSKTWKYTTPLPSPIINPQVCVLRSQLYVMNSTENSIEIFDPYILKWNSEVLPENLSTQNLFGIVALDDVIVFILKAQVNYNGCSILSAKFINGGTFQIGTVLLDEFTVYANQIVFINKSTGEIKALHHLFGENITYTKLLLFKPTKKYKLLVTMD